MMGSFCHCKWSKIKSSLYTHICLQLTALSRLQVYSIISKETRAHRNYWTLKLSVRFTQWHHWFLCQYLPLMHISAHVQTAWGTKLSTVWLGQ